MLRKKMRKLTAILLSVMIAGLCQVPMMGVQAAAVAVDGYTAAERVAATLDVTGTSPSFGGFTLASGTATYNEENAALAVTGGALLKTGLFRPEYRSEYEVTFYIPEGSEGVSLATKLYFRTNAANGTDAETTSMSFDNGTLSYSDSATQAISDFTGKWITIRQEFLGAYSTVTVLDGETELFASEQSLINGTGTDTTAVRLNTITSAGLEITGAGTIYIKSADFNTRYYKKNLPFEHEFIFGEQYSDRSTANVGETSIGAAYLYTKGFFSHAGYRNQAVSGLTLEQTISDTPYYSMSSCLSEDKANAVIGYGFFPVDQTATVTAAQTNFGALLVDMPNYTKGYQVLELDLYIPSVLYARTDYPLFITSSGELAAGSNVGDAVSTHSVIMKLNNNNQYINGISSTMYPLNEWFTVRLVLDISSGTYKVQMIKDVDGVDTLYEGADTTLPDALKNGLNATTLIVPRQHFTGVNINVDNVYCYHVTDEQLGANSEMAVSINGTVEIGETLTANVSGADGKDLTYQWYRVSANNGYNENPTMTAIENAADSTYTLQSSDANYFIVVKATAENDVLGLPGISVTSDISADMFAGVLPTAVDFNNGVLDDRGRGTGFITGTGGNGSFGYYDKTADDKGFKLSALAEGDSVYIQERAKWGNLHNGVVYYTADIYIEEGTTAKFIVRPYSETEYSNLVVFSSDGMQAAYGDKVSYPTGEWFKLAITIYPENSTYDLDLIFADGTVCSVAQNTNVGDQALRLELMEKGLRQVRLVLSAGADESGSVILDNITCDKLEEKINVPMITADGSSVSAAVTLLESEVALSPSLFLALYDADGKIYKVSRDNTIAEGALGCSVSAAIPTGGMAKAFLWDSSLTAIRAISIK